MATFTGGPGSDTLSGTADDDFIYGEEELDFLYGNDGNDWIWGGLGGDRIFGGLGDDRLIGEEGIDLIRGQGGNDLIWGGIGDDELQGEGGDDQIFGGEGDELIFGQTGNDKLHGELGNDRLFGGDGEDRLFGQDGDDFLRGQADNDTLFGGAGLDELQGEGGDDRLFGGDDNDDLFGQSGNDELQGEGGNDRLFGGDGNDRLYGQDGDDLLRGQGGDDMVFGGLGADELQGEGDNDRLFGGDGNDLLFGQTGDDELQGQVGNDQLYGGTGADFLYGQEGDDELYGQDQDDFLFGGTGADKMFGGDGFDFLLGQDGDDELDGGLGSDWLMGGADNDRYVVDSVGDTVIESAGEGTDTVESAVTYILGANLENLTLTGAAAIDGTGNVLNNTITGNSAANTLTGGLGNDTYIVDSSDTIVENVAEGIDTVYADFTYTLGATLENLVLTGVAAINGTGNSLANTITGNSAANTLTGEGGNDILIGGLGDDTYIIVDASDTITENAAEGTDTVQSSVSHVLNANVESLVLTGVAAISGVGNSLDNTITGNSAANTLNGGTGADTLIGGDGDETYIVDNVGDTITENAAEGTDTVQSSVTYTLAANIENLLLSGFAAINGIGNALANTITGNSAANMLDGGTGADTLIGGLGDDTYVVDDAGDTVTENAAEGTDTVQSSVTYTLSANLENLVLTGVAAINGTGNALANIIIGNSAANILDGAAGGDALFGWLGDDTYIVDNVGDVVLESVAEGTDTVQSSVSYVLNANVENLVLTGVAAIFGVGNSLSNILTGNSAANMLDGATGADTLIGGLGDDTYFIDNAGDTVTENAAEGIDTVQSSITYTLGANLENLILSGVTAIDGTGNTLTNTITGNSAANTLDGGLGADALVGGLGNDTYIVDHAGDTVTELAASGTEIVYASVTHTLAANVENLILTGVAAINGIGNALANAITGNSAANTLTGNGGNDTLDGGAGADTLIGGLNNDTYVVDDADDTIAENVAEGYDTVQSSLTYTLGANLEVLVLTGVAAIDGTGNDVNNNITGNSAANILDGGAGADFLIGGPGDDTYVVDNMGDAVLEYFNEGIDTVFSSVTYGINGTIEHLVLTGVAAIDGTGNTLANSITGNSAANTLTGHGSNDTLDGGAGADTLIGGWGDDIYIVDNVSDTVTEVPLEGTDTVFSSVTYTLSTNVENLVLTGAATIDGTGDELNNSITGNSAVNTLTGNGGNDTLDGGAGADTLIGGLGNDTYIIDASDTIVEAAAEGGDSVHASFTYTLGADLEYLRLTGTSAIDGTGNSLDNTLIGNDAANILDGGTGADMLRGGLGDDTYIVDDAGDRVTEGGNAGIDTVRSSVRHLLSNDVENLVLTGVAAIDGTGNSLTNTITGNSAVNTLDGGFGADTLIGGLGDDTYVVDDAGDTVIEYAAEGTDTVLARVSYTLGANVENLVLGNLNGTGNTLDNTITGNNSSNTLDGGMGADTLLGGRGDDTYIVDNVGDVVIENAAEGTDTVQSSATRTLSAHVENLVLTGISDLDGMGNTLANIITGNSAANTLDGGSGDDTLIGGLGDDLFVVAGGGGNDTISGFIAGAGTDDAIDLSAFGFTDLGSVLAAASQVGSNVLISLSGGGSLTLLDVALADLHEDDFVFAFSPVAFELSDLETGNGSLGFVLNGVSADDWSGWPVSSAGDVNGDGLGDLIIGARSDDPNGDGSGASFVVFGSASDITSGDGVFELSDIETGNGSLGFVLNGISLYDASGQSVSSVGDVNGDGFDDLIIGAAGDDPNGDGSGTSFVVFGSATDITGGDGVFELSDIETGNGTLGFVLNGVSAGDASGHSVASVGDFNGDGLDDLIVGAFLDDPNGGNDGASFVVFGSASDITGGDGVFELSDIETGDGSLGFVLNGISTVDWSGWSVSSAGDFNGDGFDDLIIGAHRDDPNGSASGASFVVFGSASDITGGDGVFELSDIETGDGSLGFVLNGVSVDDYSGVSVSSAGDVNGDGFDDLIVGADGDDPNGGASGASFVVFGNASDITGGDGVFELSDIEIGDGSLGYVLNGVSAGDYSGWSVSSAGDVNGDGLDDLIVGARSDDPNGNASGASFVVFGSASDITGGDGVFELSDVGAGDGSLGFVLNGVSADDESGRSVSSAGDVNGDGFDDLIVGARLDDPNGYDSGASFVIFGGNFTGSVDLLGGAGADVLNGTASDDIIIAAQGDDVITGNAGNDRMTGALGDDRFVFNDGDGDDTVVDFVAGAGTDDALVISATFGLADLAAILAVSSQVGDDVVIALDGDDSVTLKDVQLGDLHEDDILFSPIVSTPAAIELSALELGSDPSGFVINGVRPSDQFGRSVSGAGDINGDGLDDVIVGAYYSRPFTTKKGAAYVVFGKADGSAVEASDIEQGIGGFVITGISATDLVGSTVSGAGDVNGDGLDDLIVGIGSADPNGDRSGAAYVVFGKADGASVALSDIEAGIGGFAINGGSTFDAAGGKVSSAGDVNGDGLDDLFVAAKGADTNGQASGATYVVFGKADGTPVELSDVGSGIGGFAINGASAYDQLGFSLSDAGDVNGDGLDDLIALSIFSAASYVVFGKADGTPVDASDILGGSGGFAIDMSSTNALVASGAGDVNGDGFDDLIIGTPFDGIGRAGGAYVVFGKADGTTVDLVDVKQGIGGFTMNGASGFDYAGESVSSAGDANGDGLDDLIVGAIGADPNGGISGSSYVVFGKADGTTVELADVELGIGGFVINGSMQDASGWSVSGAGDVDGDGFDDVIVGAPYDDPSGPSSGASFVVFGGNFTGSVNVLGTSGNDVLIGTAGNDIIIGAQGDDTITGGLGDDRLTGALGDDIFVLIAAGGDDTVVDFMPGAGSDDTLDLSAFGFADTAAVMAASSQVGDDVVIALDVSVSVTLSNILLADLHADDFTLV